MLRLPAILPIVRILCISPNYVPLWLPNLWKQGLASPIPRPAEQDAEDSAFSTAVRQ